MDPTRSVDRTTLPPSQFEVPVQTTTPSELASKAIATFNLLSNSLDKAANETRYVGKEKIIKLNKQQLKGLTSEKNQLIGGLASYRKRISNSHNKISGLTKKVTEKSKDLAKLNKQLAARTPKQLAREQELSAKYAKFQEGRGKKLSDKEMRELSAIKTLRFNHKVTQTEIQGLQKQIATEKSSLHSVEQQLQKKAASLQNKIDDIYATCQHHLKMAHRNGQTQVLIKNLTTDYQTAVKRHPQAKSELVHYTNRLNYLKQRLLDQEKEWTKTPNYRNSTQLNSDTEEFNEILKELEEAHRGMDEILIRYKLDLIKPHQDTVRLVEQLVQQSHLFTRNQ